MDYAVYKHDIQHIILDNLQFMTPSQRNGGGSSRSGNFDKFDNQDTAIEAFRKFATTRNVRCFHFLRCCVLII